MDIVALCGKNGNYIYSPETVLKAKGKFNSVYIGADATDKSKVIIKKLNKNLKNNQQALQRFLSEFYADFKHKNIATTLDFFEQDDEYYIVREYFEGIDLQNLMRNKKLAKKAGLIFILKCYAEALNGLKAIHSHGIIHRDIRPSNLLVEFLPKSKIPDYENPAIKIIDFGLCKRVGEEQLYKSPFALLYSPPEQVLNFDSLVNETSDLYSLGISLYETICRKLPFRHINPEVMMNLQIVQELKPDSKIPKSVFAIIQKATSKYKFPVPPNRYPQSELLELLSKGQKLRYLDALHFREDLLKCIEKLNLGHRFDWLKKLFNL